MRRSLFRPVAVLAMTGGLVVGTALPAFAHHPILSGTVVCSASWQQVITWTVKNSENNKTMTVKSVAITSGTVPNLLNSVFTASQSKTFTTTLPGTQTGSVKLTVGARWNTGETATRDASVTLKTNCKPPVTTTTSTSTTTTSTTTSSTTTTTTAPTTTTTAPSVTTTTVRTEVLGETLTKPAETPEVLAEQANKPAPGGPLAHTGAAIGLLAFIGGGLLWIGLPLSRYKRRQHED
jgi:hypothetical protein